MYGQPEARHETNRRESRSLACLRLWPGVKQRLPKARPAFSRRTAPGDEPGEQNDADGNVRDGYPPRLDARTVRRRCGLVSAGRELRRPSSRGQIGPWRLDLRMGWRRVVNDRAGRTFDTHDAAAPVRVPRCDGIGLGTRCMTRARACCAGAPHLPAPARVRHYVVVGHDEPNVRRGRARRAADAGRVDGRPSSAARVGGREAAQSVVMVCAAPPDAVPVTASGMLIMDRRYRRFPPTATANIRDQRTRSSSAT
jgi:hypothetical protein